MMSTDQTFEAYDQALPDWTPFFCKSRRITKSYGGIRLRWKHSINTQCQIELYIHDHGVVFSVGRDRKHTMCAKSPQALAELVGVLYRDFQARYFSMTIMKHIIDEAISDFHPFILEWPNYTQSTNDLPHIDIKLGRRIARMYQVNDTIHLVCYEHDNVRPGSMMCTHFKPKFWPLELSNPEIIQIFRSQFMDHFATPAVSAHIQSQIDSAYRSIQHLQEKIVRLQTQREAIDG